MNKYKVIAIMGEAGSGKDTILQETLKQFPEFFHEVISYTTRPPREGEVNGKNYHFVTKEEFAELVVNDKMFEATSFNGWFYGTGIDSLNENKINIGVFNPDGIDTLADCKNLNIVVFYARAADKTRLLRQLNREENPDVDEIIRRFKTDKEDFYDFDFHYNEIQNETKEDLQKAVLIIESAAQMLKDKII